jgi:predicted alpha/beta-fold hydrolase
MWSILAIAIAVVVITAARRSGRVLVIGGRARKALLGRVRTLAEPCRVPWLLSPSGLQLFLFCFKVAFQERWARQHDTFNREPIPVGKGTHADHVTLAWLETALPPEAPIAVLLPGLNCDEYNMPGTELYNALRDRYRVVVYKKRGLEDLVAPVVHLFGDPSELDLALRHVHQAYPTAAIHVVSMSSGNGLAGSHAVLHKLPPRCQSYLLLCGGEDYSIGFNPPRADWMTRLLCEYVLFPTTLAKLLRHAVLRAHPGFKDCINAKSMQDLYDATEKHFAGAPPRQINGFSGSSAEGLRHVTVPLMLVCTADDPIQPGGIQEHWVETICTCDHVAYALFPFGTHLPCFESWTFRSWIPRLAREWLDAQDSGQEPALLAAAHSASSATGSTCRSRGGPAAASCAASCS